MFRHILSSALLVSGLSAQVVYDNGPFETSPGESLLENTVLGLTIFGYGGQGPGTGINNALYDDFAVPVGMTVSGVEFFCYQTNGGTTPLITMAYVNFYSADPAGGASPIAVIAMAPTASSFSGVYRRLDVAPTSTARAIWQITLDWTAMPILLAPGRYWIGLAADGSSSFSGPWFPPIACLGQQVTGDGQQSVSGSFSPTVSGAANYPQGIPFRLLGVSALPLPTGFTQLTTGCGGTGISICGSNALGGFVRTELTLTNPPGIGIIGYDIGPPSGGAFCSCTTINQFEIAVWFVTAHDIILPAFPNLVGLPITIQGAEAFPSGPGGCAAPPINFTDGYMFFYGAGN